MGCVSSKADDAGSVEAKANQAAKYAAPAEQPAAVDAGKADAPPAHGPPTPSKNPEAKAPGASNPADAAQAAAPVPPADVIPAAASVVPAPAAPAGTPAPAPATKRQSAAGLPDGADDGQVVSKLRTDCKIRDVYTLGKVLGTGGFSIVKLAVEKATGIEYACKIMSLPTAPHGEKPNVKDPDIPCENSREDIFKEIDILCGLNHENILFLKEYFEEHSKVYLITELVTSSCSRASSTCIARASSTAT